ncbi:MAG: MIP/aquaporin family protein [Bacteroidota bacterium]
MNSKSLLVEFIGTFFLVLVIGLTVIAPGAGALAPVAIGAVLMVMVYAGGPISGAHYNPAVTLAVWMRGKAETKTILPYMIAQSAGGVVAGLVVNMLKAGAAVEPMALDTTRAMIVEVLFTFALAYVVLNVATSKKSAGNSYFGLAIGLTVTAAAYAGGAISGGVYNPAVAFGITVMGLGAAANIWIYLVSTFLGGALAAVVYKMVNPDEV